MYENAGGVDCYDNDDLAIIAAGIAQYYPTEQEMVGYTIKDGGIYMIMEETTYALDDSKQVWNTYAASDLYKAYTLLRLRLTCRPSWRAL